MALLAGMELRKTGIRSITLYYAIYNNSSTWLMVIKFLGYGEVVHRGYAFLKRSAPHLTFLGMPIVSRYTHAIDLSHIPSAFAFQPPELYFAQ
jgi:hypothetical protein